MKSHEAQKSSGGLGIRKQSGASCELLSAPYNDVFDSAYDVILIIYDFLPPDRLCIPDVFFTLCQQMISDMASQGGRIDCIPGNDK